MKVLQINTVCGIGSTGRIATDIAEVLQNEGNECVIAYGIGDNNNKRINSIKIGTKIEVHIHSVLSKLFDMQGRGSYWATKRFIKKIKKYNPDVVHLHNLHGCYINIKLLFNYLKENNKPVIWTLHDCWSFTGHCAHFDYINCNKWLENCTNCPQKKEYPETKFLSFSKNNLKWKKNIFSKCNNITLVTPSEWLCKLVKESFLNKYSVKVINNGIDLEKFYKMDASKIRIKYNLDGKFVILGVASTWEKKKGLSYFIELAKKLDERFKIILIGIPEKEKIPSNIISISRTNNIKELAEFYSVADVFVNPTLEDNFPTTNLEAVACGTPVITFNTGGSPESIDETCGKVVEKGNIEELYSEIINLWNKNLKQEDCITRSKMYDKKDKYNEYIQLYTKIINGEKSNEK